MAAAEPTGPERIAGYRIERTIGRGGMGTVYEAFDEKMKRRVALKVMQHRLSSSPKAHERFQREAWIAGRMDHPNIVRVFDRGVWIDYEYFAMELVTGGSLHDMILSMRDSGRDARWNLEFGTREYIAWAISRIADAARGLEYAHRNGVIHRDVKPMNILLSADPCIVKIADFGIAVEEDATRMTTEGHVLGTVAYMAPEQIKGWTDQVNASSDIYSLGVALFEMLTLELPFAASSREVYVNSVLTDPARRPSRLNDRVSRDLDVVLGKALEKEPRDRYATAGEFADDLQNVLDFRPIRARPPSASNRIAKWVRRKPMHAALSAILIIGVPTVGALAIRSLSQQRMLEQVEIRSLLDEASRLYRDNRSAEALDPLGEVLRRDPEHLKALRTRSFAYLDLATLSTEDGRRASLTEKALEDAARAAAIVPGAAWPYTLRAHIKRRMGRPESAEEDLRQAARRRSEKPSLDELQFEGLLAVDDGDHGKAEEIFTGVIARDPGIVEARINRARVRERLGDLTGAVADSQVAAGLMPSDPWRRYELGRLLTLAGSLEEGAMHYRQAIEMQPGIADFHAGLADNLLARGRTLAAGGSPQEALANFEAAEAATRRALEIDGDLIWGYVNLGASLMEQYRTLEDPAPDLVAEATSAYQRVIALWRAGGANLEEGAYLATLVNQCDALIQTGQYDRALEICRAAVEADPRDAVNHYNLAGVYALLGRTGEALDSLERDLELGDTDWEYLESDRWFDAVRGHPRYAQIVERMKQAAAGS